MTSQIQYHNGKNQTPNVGYSRSISPNVSITRQKKAKNPYASSKVSNRSKSMSNHSRGESSSQMTKRSRRSKRSHKATSLSSARVRKDTVTETGQGNVAHYRNASQGYFQSVNSSILESQKSSQQPIKL